MVAAQDEKIPGAMVSYGEGQDLGHRAGKAELRPAAACSENQSMQKSCLTGAERVRRSREHAAKRGFRPLSILLPQDLHPQLKTFAARVKAGEPAGLVVAELFPVDATNNSEGYGPLPAEGGIAWPDELPRWRRWLLRQLLPKSRLRR